MTVGFFVAVLAFTERHFGISDRVCSLYSVMTGVMSTLIPLVLGQTFSQWPIILFVLEMFFVSLSFIMFITVRLWIWKDGSKANGKY